MGTYPSLVPRIEAFALPCIVERATSKPTPICIHLSLYGYKTYRLDAISHPVKGCELTHPESTYRCYVLTMHEVCEVSIRQEQSAKYAPFPLCRDSYSESSANIRIMFERTKVLSKKSSLRDKIHQNLPSLRDFSVFNHAMRNFYCTFAPVLEKATNKTEE